MDIFIAATGSGLARAECNPNGQWAVEHLLGGQAVKSVAVSPHDSNIIYAGLANGDVWRSPDYGDAWEKMPFNLQSIWFSLLIL